MEELNMLVDLRQQVQKARIAFGNRLAAVERGADTMEEEAQALTQKWYDALRGVEDDVNADLVHVVKRADMPVFDHLIELKGIGEISAAKIVTEIDIAKCNTVSALWRFAGYGVVNGQRERPVKGEKLHYNRDLKIAVRLAVESFLKARSPYAEIYYAEKERRLAQPDMTKMHAHNMAIGKVAKVFLCHLWERWRRLEGLPTRDLYVMERLGHENYLEPEAFGWPKWEANIQE